MFKKLYELLGWLYLRSISKPKDFDLFWLSQYDKNSNRIITPYNRLAGRQIEAILKIVDREIVKSYQFGLKISREQMLKEKAATLGILNEMGNLSAVPDNLEFEKASKFFSERINELMKEELAFYFEKLSKEGKVRNMYNCHLEGIRDAILHAIYNKSLPYT